MEYSEYIRGTIKTLILKLLTEKEKMYGYEISARVKELSGEEIELTYGALYPILYKLEADELLTAESEVVDNRARKYYSLTKKGKEVAREKVSELERFIDIIKSMLQTPKASLEIYVP